MKSTDEVYPIFKAKISLIKQEVVEGIRISRRNQEQVRLNRIYMGLKDLEQELNKTPTITQVNFEEIVNAQKRRDRNCQGVTLHLSFIPNAKRECFVIYPINLALCQKNI